MKFKNMFLLSWKRFAIVLLIFIASVFFHNIISGLTGIDEPVFFIVSVIIVPVYLIISGIYSLYSFKEDKGRKK